jgi:hypothetical protein
MPKKNSRTLRATQPVQQDSTTEQYVRVRLKALEIPPIKDGILIGKTAPIGPEAMLRMLKLVGNDRFIHFPMKDDIIADIIIRESVLKKLKEHKLKEFILTRIKPLMSDAELLLLNMDIEVVVEDTL